MACFYRSFKPNYRKNDALPFWRREHHGTTVTWILVYSYWDRLADRIRGGDVGAKACDAIEIYAAVLTGL